MTNGKPDIWFRADDHFYHELLIKGIPAKNRPPMRPMFSTKEEMNERLIAEHNALVHRGDIVYDLGDMFLKCTPEQALDIRRRLNGNFYLILGNHDKVTLRMWKQHPEAFVWVEKYKRIKAAGIPIFLCHYAMRTWSGSHKGVLHLYGHSHGQLAELPGLLAFDVGVDCWNFKPPSLEQVLEKMKVKASERESMRLNGGDIGDVPTGGQSFCTEDSDNISE